ncbi:hypothetical protein H0H92_005631 [Tricholoma furcatifolium]|nr:hypothetical protein H0H92_005631 [Tricholoma furcatifolium]
MSLRRVGGKSDGGIDLLGWWWLPPLNATEINAPRRRLRVLAQCKAEKKKIGPKYVREMEGVLHRYLSLASASKPSSALNAKPFMPPGISTPQYPLVGLFISESPFTKATFLQAQSSPLPLFLLHIPPLPLDSDTLDADGWSGSAVWNQALASTRGLLRGEVDLRWERAAQTCGRPGLWWRDQKLKNWTPETDGSPEMEEFHFEHEDLLLQELAPDTE